MSPTATASRFRLAATLSVPTLDDPLPSETEQLRAAVAALEARLAATTARLAETTLELEETNRGVVALYAELDERASYLERLSEAKTRWLSHLSHELRTPLNAVRSLAMLLLDGLQGPLSPAQREPVELIRSSADQLRELVDDWLDLAKIEAGKTVVRTADFTAGDLLAALRGMFRPLATNEAVTLTVEDPPADLAPLFGDEAKVAQILRNLMSNALKFTRRGTVRVWAQGGPGDTVHFVVSDTGVGIAPADQARVFEEFGQVEHSLQREVKGTGLGLPLSRQLARLLGGDIALESAPGVGSTFTLVVPRAYTPVERRDALVSVGRG
jgi:signal transduction histidine kinase